MVVGTQHQIGQAVGAGVHYCPVSVQKMERKLSLYSAAVQRRALFFGLRGEEGRGGERVGDVGIIEGSSNKTTQHTQHGGNN